MSVLWPRVTSMVARQRIEELRSNPMPPGPPSTVVEPTRTFAATGGRRVSDGEIADLRKLIVETANEFGFPRAQGREAAIAFDRRLAPLLVSSMNIVPAEAATRPMWSHLSLVVAPDVTHWRFGFDNEQRWIASDLTRHMFSRLWWQGFLLDDRRGDRSLLDELTESDINQLLERTNLGGMRRVVVALGWAVVDGPTDVNRRDLIRDAARRMLRRMVFIDHLALSSEQLAIETRAVVDETAAALRPAAVTVQAQPDFAPSLPPAAWFPDPLGVAAWRWWDGVAWTDQVHQ